MSTAVTAPPPAKPKTGLALVNSWLEAPKVAAELAAAVAGWWEPAKFRVSLLAYLGRTTQVHDCEQHSLLHSIMTIASLQLVLPRQAIIVPRWNKKANKMEAHPTVTFHGMQALMTRCDPSARYMVPVIVHRLDTVILDATGTRLIEHHRDIFNPLRTFKSWDDVQGAYLYIPGPPERWHFVTKEHLQKAESCADKHSTTWADWLEEMCSKTVVRHAYARGFILVDPAMIQVLESIFEHDDTMLGNDPRRVSQSNPAAIASRDLHSLSRPATTPTVAPVATPTLDVPSESSEEPDAAESEPEASDEPVLEGGPLEGVAWSDVDRIFSLHKTEQALKQQYSRLEQEYPPASHGELGLRYIQAQRKLAGQPGALFVKGHGIAE